MSIQEIHERMAQGWTLAEARMGKDWKTEYPNIANWHGGYSVFGSDSLSKIDLQAHCGSEFSGFHTTTYVLAEKEIALSPEQDIYQVVDEFIKTWNEEHGAEAILRFKKGWIGEANWQTRYPHIANWINQGKRHCISIRLNCVTHRSYAKAWLYDKPSNRETVLFEQHMENMTDNEVLKMLDEGIKTGVSRHKLA